MVSKNLQYALFLMLVSTALKLEILLKSEIIIYIWRFNYVSGHSGPSFIYKQINIQY